MEKATLGRGRGTNYRQLNLWYGVIICPENPPLSLSLPRVSRRVSAATRPRLSPFIEDHGKGTGGWRVVALLLVVGCDETAPGRTEMYPATGVCEGVQGCGSPADWVGAGIGTRPCGGR